MEGRCTFSNRVAAEMLGYTEAELLGQNMHSLAHHSRPDGSPYPVEDCPIYRAFKSGQGCRVSDDMFLRRDGTPFPVEYSSFPILDGDAIMGAVVTVLDISERRRSEESLRASEERYRVLFDACPAGYIKLNSCGQVEAWNPAAEAIFGWSAAEATAFSSLAFLVPETLWDDVERLANKGEKADVSQGEAGRAGDVSVLDWRHQDADSPGSGDVSDLCRDALLVRLLSNLLTHRKPVASVNENVTKDGRTITCEWLNIPIHDAMGNATGFLSVVQDVTERSRAEMALRESELRFRELVENMNEVFWIAGPDFHEVVHVSPAYEAVWGRTCESLYSMPHSWSDAIHPDDRDRVLALLAEQASRRTDTEYRIVRPDGSVRWIHDRSAPIRNEAGDFYRVAGIAEDITERKMMQEQVKRQFQRITAQRAIDMAITGSMDLRLTLGLLLDQVREHLEVDAAHIMLLNRSSLELEHFAMRGFRSRSIASSRVRLGAGLAGRAALAQQVIQIENLRAEDTAFLRADLIAGEMFVSYMAVPLMAKGQVYGVLEIFHKTMLDPTAEWREFLDALCSQAAIAIENARMFGDLQRSNTELMLAYDETIEGWAKALDLRDQETEGHTRRVTDMAIRVARALGVAEKDVVHIRRGALLHDIGKLGVRDAILLKPGKLDAEEWEAMKMHTTYAEEWLSSIAFLRPALEIPVYHHEKWDGSGYPRGLRGEAIPLAARIFAVVDVWDALRSERPYKPAWSFTAALSHIRDQAGKHFDPKAVTALEQVLLDLQVAKGDSFPQVCDAT